jgi:hypothetical protein
MPVLDERIELALRGAAPDVERIGVLERVAVKRERRRVARRARTAAAMLGILAVIVTLAFAVPQDHRGARVAAPGGGGPGVQARVITDGPITAGGGAVSTPEPVALDTDEGYLRGPLTVYGDTASLAAYDRDGSAFRFPPSRVVRIDTATLHVVQRVDLKAEVLSIVDVGTVRWILTRNPAPANGLPDVFLKRVSADGTVVSVLVPPPADPVGAISVTTSSVWVPVRDGVLRFDPATARFVARLALPPADTRTVIGLGGSVWVPDGGSLRLVESDDPSMVPVIEVAPAGDVIVGLAPTGDGDIWVVTRSTETGRAVLFRQSLTGKHGADIALPGGFRPTGLRTANGRTWVEGTGGAAPAIVLIQPNASSTTLSAVVLDGATDASLAWVADRTVLAVSGGQVLRITVKR